MSAPARTLRTPETSHDVAVRGRGSIFTAVGEWVLMAPISDRATRVYWALRAHVNVSRKLADGETPDDRAFPSQARLAAMIGVKRTETISAAIAELVAIGAVDVEVRKYANGLRRKNTYTVHMDPPPGYTGPLASSEFDTPSDQQQPAVESENPQVSPEPGNQGGRTPSESGGNKTKNNKTKETSSLPARPHADAGGRKVKAAKTPKPRQADHPASDDWVTPDDPGHMVAAILAHVDQLYGAPDGLEQMLTAKAEPDFDDEDYVIPGSALTPTHLMNLALKAGRWGTVDFAAIKAAEKAGYGPDGKRLDGQPEPAGVYSDPWAS